MSFTIQLHLNSSKQITLSELSNQTSTTAKSTPIFDDFEQCEDVDQIQPSNEDFIHNFFQQRNYVIKKMAQINQQTDNQPKRITELRRLIFIKPQLQEAIELQNLLKNNGSVFNRQILQDITDEIELSFKCLKTLQDFYQTQNSLPQSEKMIQTSHMVESTWQQIERLSIYDPELINEVSKLEWIFRAIEVLSHDRADSQYPYIQYCKTLKHGALESQSDEIMKSKFYKRIEEELHEHQSIVEKVNFIFEQERNRAPANQEQKMDVEEAKNLLRQLKKFGFGMNQEIASVEGVLKRALDIEKEYLEFVKKRTLASPEDLFKLTRQIRSLPVNFLRIEEHLNKLFKDQEEQVKSVLQDTAQRILEENKELYLHFIRFAEVNSGAGEALKAYGQEFQRMIIYSGELIENFENFKFEDLGLVSQQMPTIGYEHIKAELWLARMRILRIFCESTIKPFNPISFEELRSFLSEIQDYVDSLPNLKRIPFDEQIVFIYCLLQQTKVWIRAEREKQKKSGKRNSDKVFYGFIDVTKKMMKPLKKQQQPVNMTNCSKQMKFKGDLPQIIESLNQKRGRIDETVDSYEKKIEKKMKKRNDEVYPLAFRSSGIEIQQKSQPERLRIGKSDNIHNCLEELPKRKDGFQNELFEEKFGGLKDCDITNECRILESNKVIKSPIDIKGASEKFQEAEELLNELNQEMLFDENFVLENNVLGKFNMDGSLYLNCLDDEFLNDLGTEFKLKKKKKYNAQAYNIAV